MEDGRPARGMQYYSNLVLPVYEGDDGKNLSFKDFMIDHVTRYQAGLFVGLASDWPALSKWDLATEEGR